MVFNGGLDTDGLRCVGEKVQSGVSNIRNAAIGFELPSSEVAVDGDQGRNYGSNQLSDPATSTELSFRKPEIIDDGTCTQSSTWNGYSSSVTWQPNQDCLTRAQLKKGTSDNSPSAPPLDGFPAEIDHVVDPSSPCRARDSSRSPNCTVPANTDCARKSESLYSTTPLYYSSRNGISQSPLRTPANVHVYGSPLPSTPRLPVFHASLQGPWCGVIAYDACVRLCLHAWDKSCFLENQCALLRDAFGLRHVLLQSELELLAEQRLSQPPLITAAAPKPVKIFTKIEFQVRKVQMGADEPAYGCSFPSPLPRIDYDNCRRRFSNLKSNLSSWKDSISPRISTNGFFSPHTNTVRNHSPSSETMQETYTCLLRMMNSTEDNAVEIKPGSGFTSIFFQDGIRDDLIIIVQNSKGQHCGHAIVQVATITDKQGCKIRTLPIYSDLEDESVGKIQLSMEHSHCASESNHQCGSIAQTLAYDYVLEVAMKAEKFQQRNLSLNGPWRCLLTEFASHYGVSNAYTNLRYLSYVMDVATPTEDCLTLIYDLLSDVKAKGTLLSRHENCMLARIEDQVKKIIASVFENYKSLEESSLSGMADGLRPVSGLAAPALAPAVRLYTLLEDILSRDAQLKLCKCFQVAAKKRLRMHCAETDELVQPPNEGSQQRDIFTSYRTMKSLILSIRNEVLTDIQIQSQNILPSCIDLPNISSCVSSVNLCSRLQAFLVACPPRNLSPPVAELIVATANFQRDLLLWNIKPIKGGVDAKELFHLHISMWIQDKHRHFLDQCQLDKEKSTEHGTSPLIDDMHNQLMEMLKEFEIIISRWPIYSYALENVIANVEKVIVESLDKKYADVLSPLKDNLTNKILGLKQKLSRQSINLYSIPKELGVLLNSMKRMLDVLWPQIENQLMCRSCYMADGYATGEHLNEEAVVLRTKYRSYRLAIVEKLAHNTRVHRATKLKNIIRGSNVKESDVGSRMQPLEMVLRETIDHLFAVVDPSVFVELCREFWDRMGQDILHLFEDGRKSTSQYKGLHVAVSIMDDIFRSKIQRLRGNSVQEEDLAPPRSIKEVHSIIM